MIIHFTVYTIINLLAAFYAPTIIRTWIVAMIIDRPIFNLVRKYRYKKAQKILSELGRDNFFLTHSEEINQYLDKINNESIKVDTMIKPKSADQLNINKIENMSLKQLNKSY